MPQFVKLQPETSKLLNLVTAEFLQKYPDKAKVNANHVLQEVLKEYMERIKHGRNTKSVHK